MPQSRNWYGEVSPMTQQDWDKFDAFRRRLSDLTVVVIDATGAQHMHSVLTLPEALEKFEELRRAGFPKILAKNGNRTIKRFG